MISEIDKWIIHQYFPGSHKRAESESEVQPVLIMSKNVNIVLLSHH